MGTGRVNDGIQAEISGHPVNGSRDRRSILTFDPSRVYLDVIGRRLARIGFDATLCPTPDEVIGHLHARRFDAIVIDTQPENRLGLALLNRIRTGDLARGAPVIAIIERSSSVAAIEALRGGADDFIAKPFDFDVFAQKIDKLIEHHQMVQALIEANEALDARVGQRAAELGTTRDQLRQTLAEKDSLAAELAVIRSQPRA